MAEVAALAIVAATGATGATAVAITIAVKVAVTLLVQQIAKNRAKGDRALPGLRTEVTLEGGTLPQTRLLGRTATAGALVAPYFTNGKSGDVPNAFLYKVIDIADAPVHALRGLWLGDVYFAADENLIGSLTSYDGATPNPDTHPEWVDGGSESGPSLWVKFFDGRQTAADKLLVDRFSTHKARPWTANRIGTGVSYVRTIHRYDDDVVEGDPSMLYVVDGERLYDRRKDSTAGGSGSHRLGTPTTWAKCDNPMVMVESILRGMATADGTVWGLGVDDADMPLASWKNAQDHCDEIVDDKARYRAGIEVVMATAQHGGTDPFEIIDELLKSCAGEIADCGGTWVAKVGPPGLPVAFLTDDDLVVSSPQDYRPHDGVTDTYNGVRALYADQDDRWKSKEAPLRLDKDAVKEDGEQLIATLDLSKTVYTEDQVQRLQRALLKDARRMRRHTLVLPPDYSFLLPFDVISWNSERNGYVTKLFEVAEVAIDPTTLATTVAVREVDPSDYDWSPDFKLPSVPTSSVKVPTIKEGLPGFAVEGVILRDGANKPRRPAIKVSWSPIVSGQRSVTWQTRIAANDAPGPGGTSNAIQSGVAYQADLLPDTDYEVRAKGDRTDWTPWRPVRTPNVKLALEELDVFLTDELERLDSISDGLVNQVAVLRDEIGGYVDDLALDDLRNDDDLDDASEAHLESLIYARQEREDSQADLAYVREESNALITDNREAIAKNRIELGSAIEANKATILVEQQTRADEDRALAFQITQLKAETKETNASVEQTLIAQAEETQALAATYEALEARTSTAEGKITNTQAAVADETEARTTAVNSLKSRTSAVEATASTTATTVADLKGNAASSLVFRVGAGSAEGTVELVAASNPDGSVKGSGLYIDTDLVRIRGTTQMDNAVVDTLKIKGEAVTVTRAYGVSWDDGEESYATSLTRVWRRSVSLKHDARYIFRLNISKVGSFNDDSYFRIVMKVDGDTLKSRTIDGQSAISLDYLENDRFLNEGTYDVDVEIETRWNTLQGMRGIRDLDLFIFGAAR